MHVSLLTKTLVTGIISAALACGATAPTTGDQAEVIWVAIDGRLTLNKISTGGMMDGNLTRGVYWRDQEIFPKGSRVRMVVDKVETRRKSFRADDRPFVIHLFAPRHELAARFRSVSISSPDGTVVPFLATFIALNQRVQLSSKHSGGISNQKKSDATFSGQGPKKTDSPWTLTLMAEPDGTTFAGLAAAQTGILPSPTATRPAFYGLEKGTQIRVAFIEGMSAARNHGGQEFRAVLIEPVMIGSTVAIPQGSTLHAVLEKCVPPRRLYRPASLRLTFDRLTLPGGATIMISASPVTAEVDKGTHLKMDSEGTIHAQSPGTARFLLDFAVSGGISKISDDTAQLIIEAISSAATDASTAGVARIAALSASAIYMLTRHGRDVILPPFTEMNVSLNRTVYVATNPPEK